MLTKNTIRMAAVALAIISSTVTSNAGGICSKLIPNMPVETIEFKDNLALCKKGENSIIQIEVENNKTKKITMGETVICGLFSMFMGMCNPKTHLPERIKEFKESGILK